MARGTRLKLSSENAQATLIRKLCERDLIYRKIRWVKQWYWIFHSKQIKPNIFSLRELAMVEARTRWVKMARVAMKRGTIQ